MILCLALAVACNSNADTEEPPAPQPTATPDAEGSISGTLVLSGDAVESPDEYAVEIGCQYSSSPGVLQVTAYGAGPRPGTLSLTIGPSGMPFEDGTYTGRFSLDEPRRDGRVLLHHGDLEATIDVQENERGGLPVAEIEARGKGQNMEIEFSGRCETLGA